MDEIIGETIAQKEFLRACINPNRTDNSTTVVDTQKLKQLLDNVDNIITYIRYLQDNELILGEGK